MSIRQIAFGKIVTTEPLRILVVDDESAVASTIELVLRHLGHTADVLHDGADALARLTLFPHLYDMLVTDHSMCRISGLELVAQLRGSPFRGGIIVLSAYLGEEVEKAYLAMGAGIILQKPFEMRHLRDAVELLRPLVAA